MHEYISQIKLNLHIDQRASRLKLTLTSAMQEKRIDRKIFLSSSLGGYLLKIESITMSKTSHAKVRSRLSFLLDYYEERTTHRDFSMNSLPPTDAFQLHDSPRRLHDSRNMLDQVKYILNNHIAFLPLF